MIYEEYISIVERRLSKDYSINFDIEERGVFFDYFANSIFTSPNIEKYNKLPYCMYEIYEKIYIKHFSEINISEIRSYFNLMCSIASERLPTYQHLCNSVIGVIVCNSLSASCASAVRSMKYIRPFALYLKGWSEVQFIVADLSSKKVYLNSDAEKSIELFAFR